MSTKTPARPSTVNVTQPAYALSTPPEAKDLKHHLKKNQLFENPWPSYTDPGGFTVGVKMTRRKISGKDVSNPSASTVIVRKPEFFPTRKQPEALRATWLGHACYLLEFPSGFRVLFDPVFEERCSPLTFLGPKRFTKAPCKVEDLPIIDAVIISHNHYDHMSHPTLTAIAARHPDVRFFCGLGTAGWFRENGMVNVTEMDWWESSTISLKNDEGGVEATISCLPSQHGSARTGIDRSRMLWCSWSVASGEKNAYFAGDTAYRTVPELPDDEDDYGDKYANLPVCPAFAQIGELRGPFDVGMLPIGAYQPRFIMSSLHSNPFDAVNIFVDTQCKKALAMHWGTWVLTEEDVMEPPKKLLEALRRKALPEQGRFDICDIGESREF
ncbi:hypothetical protein DOTSEDRAFT_48373 [Dothistroma septosporum NZE10]|uniref:Metallo-beta-lactamase domain-containing protein n=1 Tax=Dothistroma septosporum (strain NZE10 / CBS 128990) TaxID=675120 RepID=M2Y0R7_DOTSN|nr:hypothetical protein DOTSEDRAFT_48373 [Dothistroma septosporum NZE10]